MKIPRKVLHRFAFVLTASLTLGSQGSSPIAAARRGQRPAKKLLFTRQDIWKATRDGDEDSLRLALENGVPANLRGNDRDSSTLLIEAAGNAAPNMVRLLLAHSARINARTTTGFCGRTALWAAANADLDEINLGLTIVTPAVQAARDAQAMAYARLIRQLVAYGADPNIPDYNGVTPLGVAAYRGRLGLTKALLDGRADPNIRDHFGKTPIEWASYNGHTRLVKLLLSRHAHVDTRRGLPGPGQRKRDVSLYNAVRAHNIPLIRSLLAQGANADNCIPSSRYDEHWRMSALTTPLLTSVGSPLVTNLLISHGANVNRSNDNGITPLMEAASGGDAEVMEILLQRGARLYARNHEGRTALMGNSSLPNLQVLLAHGAGRNGHINERDHWGNTPVRAATSEETLTTLLRHGANINARDNNGRTELMETVDSNWGEGGASACDADWARVLLQHGADTNVRDKNGNTAIMLLAFQGQYVYYNDGDPILAARLLLRHGAKLHLRNNKGQTARQIAAARHAKSLLQLFKTTQSN